MGVQAEEREDDFDLVADDSTEREVRGREKVEVEAATATDAMAEAAGSVGWGATLGTLVQIIKPWRRRFAIVVTSGIARVAAFIGVLASAERVEATGPA